MNRFSRSLFSTRTRSLLRPRFYSQENPAGATNATNATETPSSEPTDATKELKQKLHKAESELKELKDAYRRVLADQENLRHRTQKEIETKQEYAIQQFAKDLLNTADILQLALDAVPEHERGEDASHPDLKNLYVGVLMTRKELLKTFEKYGITSFNPQGHEFDFNLHTAIFQTRMEGMKEGMVCHVDKVGYKIKDRVLRPASVGVVKGE